MKKIIIPMIIFILCFNLYPNEDVNLAKVYIQKAYNYYNSKQYDICEEYLNKSYNYSKIIPEYYYFMSLILDNTVDTKFQKSLYSFDISKNIQNSFLIKDYFMLIYSANVFRSVRDFNNSYNIYLKIFNIDDIELTKDYLDCIDMLFYSKITNKIPELINNAKKTFEDINLYYFQLLYEILFSNIDDKRFNESFGRLVAANYNTTKLLYIKTLYYKNLSKVYEEYDKLKIQIDKTWNKKIIYNFLQKNGSLKKQQILTLLNDWIKNNGLTDFNTNNILSNKNILKIIGEDKKLENQ
ncbi:MAG TPA: hypothetical protein PK771_01295, partial [Spirochaetota bacterium]|nr:hypothetical protein [Spirochaetota bacterium]